MPTSSRKPKGRKVVAHLWSNGKLSYCGAITPGAMIFKHKKQKIWHGLVNESDLDGDEESG